MTKEEKIKEAYGLMYETNKSKINEDGWCSGVFNLPNTHIELYRSERLYWRPKSLEGLESNNGWIAVEREKELPRQMVHLYDLNTETEWIGFLYNDYGFFAQPSATHYQPIIKPKPPIY